VERVLILTMRRVAGFTLPWLGVVLIAAAVLLPTYVSGQIVKFPLDEHTTATMAGPGCPTSARSS